MTPMTIIMTVALKMLDGDNDDDGGGSNIDGDGVCGDGRDGGRGGGEGGESRGDGEGEEDNEGDGSERTNQPCT